MLKKIYKTGIVSTITILPIFASAQLVQTGTLLMIIKNFIVLYLIPIAFLAVELEFHSIQIIPSAYPILQCPCFFRNSNVKADLPQLWAVKSSRLLAAVILLLP